jgi:glycosyltransferase involved in cell wall biosynthesis
MKILLVTTLFPLREAGLLTVTNALKDFVDEWRETDDVQVLRPVWNRMRLPLLDPDPVVSTFRGMRIPGLEGFFLDTSKLIRDLPLEPDVVVAHMFKSFLWAWKIADYYRVPFVAGIHYSDIQFLRFPHLRRRFHRVLLRADGLACRSPAMREQLLARYPELRRKTFCANSGIEAGHIRSLPFFLDKVRRWRGSREIRFATAARLQKRKNIDVTLRALSRLPSAIKWSFSIIGDGPERRRLEALSRRLNLSDRVSFLRWLPRDRVLEELLRSDIFILVSAPETFGLVYIEAMAMGNIVIGGRGWGVDGFISNDVNGYLCEQREAEDLLGTIRHAVLETSKEQIERVARGSHELVSNNTKALAAAAYRSHLREICASGGYEGGSAEMAFRKPVERARREPARQSEPRYGPNP